MSEPRTLLDNFQLVIDILSPLHIGNGEDTLLPDFDFVVDGDFIIVMDASKALDHIGDIGAVEDGKIASALHSEDREGAARYRLPFAGGGVPREILPSIKDASGKPYLPGSSVKGGLRTLIAQKLLQDEAAAGTPVRVQTTNDFGRRIPGQFAGQQIERRIFGEHPRDSVLRALRVGDLSADEGSLVVAPARVYGKEESNLTPGVDRLAVEAIPPGQRYAGTISLDRYLLNQSRGVQNGGAKTILQGMVAAGQEAAKNRIAAEREYLGTAGVSRVTAYYDALGKEAEAPAENSFLLQLGWEAGYDSKSFGPALKTSPDWAAIREQYFTREQRRGPRPGQGGGQRPGQGGPPRPGQAPRKPGDRAFPASRRLVEFGGTPELPFGWVRVWLIPVGEAVPELVAPPVAWRDEPLPEPAKPIAIGVSDGSQPGAEAPAASLEPVSPFARLQALLGGTDAEAAPVETEPLPPIPRVSDKNLKIGTILEAEIIEIEDKRLVVDLGRENPTAVDSSVLGGGNLATRFTVGQRIRLRVLNAPPFFKVRMA